MVGRDGDHVLLLAGSHELQRHGAPGRQVEVGRGGRAQHRAQRLVAFVGRYSGQVVPLEDGGGGGFDHLPGNPVDIGVVGAQRLVAADQLGQRPVQGRIVQGAAQAHGRLLVVGGPRLTGPVEEPQALLSYGERHFGRTLPPGEADRGGRSYTRGGAGPRRAVGRLRQQQLGDLFLGTAQRGHPAGAQPFVRPVPQTVTVHPQPHTVGAQFVEQSVGVGLLRRSSHGRALLARGIGRRKRAAWDGLGGNRPVASGRVRWFTRSGERRRQGNSPVPIPFGAMPTTGRNCNPAHRKQPSWARQSSASAHHRAAFQLMYFLS
ncbi:hypothetical protein EES45_01650 [Streptomyces sp. ADI97-07]|nr:hypothetical protein EES45_01650 [Streptomyces sp. ADI97-07]